MTDRTTKVTLVAEVSNYIAGLQKAAAATKATTDETKKLANQKQNVHQLGLALLAIGTVAAVGVGLAVKAFAEFDAKMALVKTLSHATGDEMKQLSEAALTMGQNIGFSATQVADAETELVKAGVSVKDIMGGALAGALQLASAGQIDVAKSTEIATIALTQFGLKGKDVPHVADLLAAGADKALGGVADLGEALKSGGLVAAQFGVSLDETVGTLSAFANAGLIGEVAGTDLRQMLLKLAAPSAQSKKDMHDLGISLYDTSGRFVGLTNLAGQLHDKLLPLTEAQRNLTLANMFGARAIAGANVLMKEGSKGISDWTNKVNDQGFAAQQAAGKMDNLQGDVKKLSAAFNVDLIRAGSAANGPLRDMAKTVTGLLKLFSDLPVPVQQGALAVGVATAAVGLAGGAFLLGVPKVLAFAGALESVGQVGVAKALQGVTGFLAGPWGIALTVGAAVLGGVFLKAQADAAAAVQTLTDSLDKQTGAFTKATRAATVDSLQKAGAFHAGNTLGISSEDVTSATLGDPNASKKVAQQIAAQRAAAEKARSSFRGPAAGFNTTDAGKALNAINALTDAMGAQSAAARQAVKDDREAAKANGVLTDAQTGLKDATSKATAAIAKNGRTLDATTTAGRTNQEALDAVANSEQGVVDATSRTSQSQSAVQKVWAHSRAELYRVAASFGLTGAAADDYVNNHLGRIPPVVNTHINVSADDALARIASVNAAYANLQARFNAGQNVIVRPGGPAIARAGGGILPGAPSSRDNMMIHAASGEFVVNARATAENRGLLDAINSGQRWVAGSPSGGHGSASSGPTTVSLEGATLHGTIDGAPFTFMIDKQIAAASDAGKAKLQNGRQRNAF